MSITDELFFKENVTNVNKMIEVILWCSIVVPVAFFLLSLPGIWTVPNNYSLSLFAYSIEAAVSYHFIIKKSTFQKFGMYYGLLAASIFVMILAYKGYIKVTLSYSFATLLSCLYYNRRLTNWITVINFVCLIPIYFLRAGTIKDVFQGNTSRLSWFFSNFIGLAIEFCFLFLITNYLTKRTQRTLHTLMISFDTRNQAYDKLKDSNARLADTQYKIIEFVSQVLASHDLFTGQHVLHTRKYVEIIAKQVKADGYYVEELSETNIEHYKTAAFLHDIGKIHIPEGILNKTGKFTPEEFELMKCHPEEGQKLLQYLPKIEDGTFNEIAIQMAYYHHEKWDGSGYPNHLAGADIPLCARIMAAADVLDALISRRLYKEPMTVDEAMEVFEKSSGSHFEPCIAESVIKLRELIKMIDNDFKVSEAQSNAEELNWWLRYHESNAPKAVEKTSGPSNN